MAALFTLKVQNENIRFFTILTTYGFEFLNIFSFERCDSYQHEVHQNTHGPYVYKSSIVICISKIARYYQEIGDLNTWEAQTLVCLPEFVVVMCPFESIP